MIFPSLNEDLKFLLWMNEFYWICDGARKLFFQSKPGQDPYETALGYIKSTLILDVIATLPQVASGMNPSFIVLKNLRLYMLWLLHYPFELFVRVVKP